MRPIRTHPARRSPGPGFLVLAAASLAGCHNNYEMSHPPPPVNRPNAALALTLQLLPATARQMDPIRFTLRLSDAHGHPVTGARVSAALVMPTMDMGQDIVTTRPQQAGVYSGSVRFSMAGDWDVVVTAVKGRRQAVQTFPVRVR